MSTFLQAGIEVGDFDSDKIGSIDLISGKRIRIHEYATTVRPPSSPSCQYSWCKVYPQ